MEYGIRGRDDRIPLMYEVAVAILVSSCGVCDWVGKIGPG